MFSQAAVASQTPLDLDAPLPTPAKRGPKNSDRAQHKRKAPRTPTTATLDIRGMADGGGLVLVVSDVLTKNDRYGRGARGTASAAAGGRQHPVPRHIPLVHRAGRPRAHPRVDDCQAAQ